MTGCLFRGFKRRRRYARTGTPQPAGDPPPVPCPHQERPAVCDERRRHLRGGRTHRRSQHTALGRGLPQGGQGAGRPHPHARLALACGSSCVVAMPHWQAVSSRPDRSSRPDPARSSTVDRAAAVAALKGERVVCLGQASDASHLPGCRLVAFACIPCKRAAAWGSRAAVPIFEPAADRWTFLTLPRSFTNAPSTPGSASSPSRRAWIGATTPCRSRSIPTWSRCRCHANCRRAACPPPRCLPARFRRRCRRWTWPV